MPTATQPTTVQATIHYLPVDSLKDDALLKSFYKPIEGEQWKRFLESIRNNKANGGCRVPILVLRVGKNHFIWDGYQRVRACRDEGIGRIACILLPGGHQMWSDEQKVLWAADMNEHRRHDMTILGRTLLYLASVKNQSDTAAEKPRQSTGRFEKSDEKPRDSTTSAAPGASGDDEKSEPVNGKAASADQAAEEAGFDSTRQAQKAAKIAKLGCIEVREALSAEHISLDEAYTIVTKNGPTAQADALVKLQRSKAEHRASRKRSSNGSAKAPRESKTSVEDVSLPLAAAINALAAKFRKAKVFAVGQLAPDRVTQIVKHLERNLPAKERSDFRVSVLCVSEAVKQFEKDMGDWK